MDSKFRLLASTVLIILFASNSEATVYKSCTEAAGSIIITCTTAGQITQSSRTSPNTLVSTPVRVLTIANQNIATIPTGIFFGMTITDLILNSNSLTSLASTSFSDATSITSIAISETNLNSIDAAAFTPVASSLQSLSLISSGLTITRFNTLKTGFTPLTGLKTLILDTNSIISLQNGFFDSFTGLTTLSVKSNTLAGLESNVFTKNTALTSLDLSSNSLTDMSQITAAVTPLASTLETLTLNNNRIATLTALPSMTALKSLDLSNNLIASLSSTTAFSLATALTSIKLASNKLSTVPSILDQPALIELDMSNQGGSYVAVAANAFARTSTPTVGAFINLDANTISTYDTKSFCSTGTQYYSKVTVSYDSFKTNFNKCLFQQLQPPNAGLNVELYITPKDGVSSYTDICNCENKVFASNYQVTLTGACATFTDACSSTTFSNTCDSTYTCTKTTSGSANVRFEYVAFIILNTLFLISFKQF